MSKVITQEELDRGDVLEDEDYSLEEEHSEENILDEDPEEEEEYKGEEEPAIEELDEEEEEENRVPIARLNKVIEQRNKERERTAWLEQQLEKLIERDNTSKAVSAPVVEEPGFDFDSAEAKYIEHILEGETDKAAKLRSQINKEKDKEIQKLVKEIKSSATEEAVSKTNASIEEDRFNTMVANYEDKYDFLNAEHDDYNEEAVDTVNALMNGFMKNMSKSQALKKAVERIAPMYDKSASKKTKLGGKGRKEDVVADRKRNAIAAQKQPTKLKGTGAKGRDLDSLDINELTEEQFRNLSEKEKRILRGDM